jgi:hypothetical protein
MRRWANFIATLMLVLALCTGLQISAAHATEIVGCVELSIEASEHAQGDGDEVPADAGKATPHHHAPCHSHHVSVPATDASLVQDICDSAVVLATASAGLTSIVASRDLRPPIA